MMFFQFQWKHHGNPGYQLSVFSCLSGAIEQRRVTFVLTDALAACRYEALIHSHSMNWYSSPCALACHRKANTCRCFDTEHLRKNKIAFSPLQLSRWFSGYFILLARPFLLAWLVFFFVFLQIQLVVCVRSFKGIVHPKMTVLSLFIVNVDN